MDRAALEPELVAESLRAYFGRGEDRLDLDALVRQLQAEIRRTEIPGDGRLEIRPDARTIFVSHAISSQRQRFTIAHELGHLWVHDQCGAPHPDGPDAEERFCDQFAAALLMPAAMVRHTVARREPETLAGVRRLAERADTSLAAALVRLGHIRRWRSSLLRYRWSSDTWQLRGSTRVPRKWMGNVATDPTTCTVLALRRGLGVGRLPVRVGPRILLAEADVEARGPNTAIALVDLHDVMTGAPRFGAPHDVAMMRALLEGRSHALVWGVAKALTDLGCHPRRSEDPGMDLSLHGGRGPVVQIKCVSEPAGAGELEWLSRQVTERSGARVVVVINTGFDRNGRPRERPSVRDRQSPAVGYVTTAELLEAATVLRTRASRRHAP